MSAFCSFDFSKQAQLAMQLLIYTLKKSQVYFELFDLDRVKMKYTFNGYSTLVYLLSL